MTVQVERVFADLEHFVIVVEYRHQPKGSTAQDKIYVDELDKDSDLVQLADDVIQRCAALSEHWRNQIIDALYDLQSNFSSKKNVKIAPTKRKTDLNIEETVSRIMESMYGNDCDKLSGLSSLLQICQTPHHLETVTRHRSFMPALARMVHDDSGDNVALFAIIIQIIASFSVFVDFHPELLHHHIGSSIMTFLKNQINRMDQLSSPDINKLDEVILASLSVLDHLSDDPSICRKMLRKGLVPLLFGYLDMNSVTLFPTISKLLLKASVYEDLIPLSTGDGSLMHLICLMKSRDETVQRNALMIFYNMSFFECFYQVVSTHDITKEIFRILHRSMNRYECFSLLYQMTKTRESRLALALPEYIDQIMGLFLQLDRQKYATEICAIVINVSTEPRCAEFIMGHVGGIITLLDKQFDGKLYQYVCIILHQLSSWTRALQYAITKACRNADLEILITYVRDPDAFIRPTGLESTDRGPISSIYKDKQYWGNYLSAIIKIARTHLHDDCLQELLATMANMTVHDLPLGCTWYDVYCKHELLDLMLGLTYKGQIRNDVILEVVALYRQSCRDEETASLLSSTRILSVLHQMWEACIEDSKMHVHLLLTCQTLLQFHSTRSILLSDKGLFEAIVESLKSTNDEVYQVAERCIELIQFLDKDENGEEGDYAKIAQARFFEYYNHSWLKAVETLMESPVIYEAES